MIRMISNFIISEKLQNLWHFPRSGFYLKNLRKLKTREIGTIWQFKRVVFISKKNNQFISNLYNKPFKPPYLQNYRHYEPWKNLWGPSQVFQRTVFQSDWSLAWKSFLVKYVRNSKISRSFGILRFHGQNTFAKKIKKIVIDWIVKPNEFDSNEFNYQSLEPPLKNLTEWNNQIWGRFKKTATRSEVLIQFESTLVTNLFHRV